MFCSVGDVILVRRLRVSPVRSRVSSPDYKVRVTGVSHHGLQGRLHQEEGRVTGIVAGGTHRLVGSVGCVVTPGSDVAPGLVLVVQVEVRDVPELPAITDQSGEAQLENNYHDNRRRNWVGFTFRGGRLLKVDIAQ